jgi:hypothetical protein
MQPGRVDEGRPVPVCFRPPRSGRWARGRLRLGTCSLPLLLVASLLLPACARHSASRDPELTRIWRDYRTLPPQRALAVAGELRRNDWVAGASGGHASRGEAEAGALAECAKRRAQRRMQAPCRLYAVGDEVVWTTTR